MLKYFIGITIILFTSCNGGKNNYSLKKDRDIKLKFETSINNLSNIAYYNEGATDYIIYVNNVNHCINFRNIETDSIDIKINLANLDSIQNTEDGVACFIHNPDSVFVLLNERNVIYLLNRNGEIRSEWKVNTVLENNNKEYVLQDIEPMKLFYKNGKIYIQSVRQDIIVNTPENKKIYFNTPPEVIIHIAEEPCLITNKTGYWPGIYKTGLGYGDYWPARCVNSKDEIIYSFAINDSLFIYKEDHLTSIINAKTKFQQNINPYPPDSNGHFAFLKKYNRTESRYKSILFDKYKDQYYRVYSKGEEKENADGGKNFLWSLIVLDSNLKTVSETEFNSYNYNDFSILPTTEGLLICQTSRNTDEKNILKFGLFNVIKDEK
jgi:hypothetical protein